MADFLLRFLLPTLLSLSTLSQAQAAAGVPLGSFETEKEASAWAASGTTTQRVEEHATDGRFALRVVFPGSQRDTWPGHLQAGVTAGLDALCHAVHGCLQSGAKLARPLLAR